jgi:hypothetical protein
VFELDWARERPLTMLRKVTPSSARARLRPFLRTRPKWGNLRRLTPFSDRYGYDRGTPIDRYLIERFLERHRVDVRGRVAEVKDLRYTETFGGDAVDAGTVVDVDRSNPQATVFADLEAPGALPRRAFDCFILAQTLQYVADPAAAIANAHASLRPGGALLVTAPSIARVDPDVGDSDLWRFTSAGLSRLLSRACGGSQFTVSSYGNLVAAVAFLEGLAAEELTAEELAHDDPSFGVVVCARVAAAS